METCPNCGQPIRATARFCTSCGYRIPERVQGTTSTSSASGFASTWIEESTGAAPEVAAAAQPASTWPASPTSTDAQTERAPAVPVVAKAEEPVAESVYAPPVVAPDPIDEIVAATAGFNEQEETIAEKSQNKVNIALYHIETLRQILPDLSNWSEERAQSVNEAIATMENAIKGREGDDDAFNGLRQTVAAAKKDPRDIDVMIALSDRAVDIEDLLKAHDAYSIGIRTALIDLKPLAVEYVRVPKRRSAPTRRASTTRSRSSASK
ncbi:MAG: zinc ribbon domain-containing protein, partial [Thermomicrobiales bacterium]|nr:zinc ribbon domain-containing protein [Thermomicrobiales bacterium]